MIVKTYDPSCYELAKMFLADDKELNTDEVADFLARQIQQCIEEEIEYLRLDPTIIQ